MHSRGSEGGEGMQSLGSSRNNVDRLKMMCSYSRTRGHKEWGIKAATQHI